MKSEFPNMPPEDMPDLTQEEQEQIDEAMQGVEYMHRNFDDRPLDG